MTNDIFPNHSIYSKEFANTWYKQLNFEIKSLYGRFLFSRKPPLLYEKHYLNLGSGDKIYINWINADFFRYRFWAVPYDWMLDLRYPINCDSNYWDGIFMEHTLEHLHPFDAINLLKESFRILKKGRYIRISVPDLKKYIEFYIKNLNQDEKFQEQWKLGAEAIRSLTQNWGHQSVWDSILLKRELESCGFQNVKNVDFKIGSDPYLCIELEERKWESLYIEGQKPF